MEDALSQGFPFELDDVWRLSTFSSTEEDNHSIFQIQDTHLPELHHDDPIGLWQQDLKLRLPKLDGKNDLAQSDLEDSDNFESSSQPQCSPRAVQLGEAELDIWNIDLKSQPFEGAHHIYSWEAFVNVDASTSPNSCYLSEAGPAAFDAAVARAQFPQKNEVLPRGVMLKALCNLAVGRSSIFFQWDPARNQFTQTLEAVSISGFSHESAASFVAMLMDCGSTYHLLAEFATTMASYKRACTAFIALQRCVTRILDSVEEQITRKLLTIRSFLQLQALIDLPYQLLKLIYSLVDITKTMTADEGIISTISNRVHEIASIGGPFCVVLDRVLAAISAPWLNRLTSDIGLQSCMIGQRNYPPPEDQGDNFNRSYASYDEDASTDGSPPDFVPKDDWKLIREARATLRMLHKHLPHKRFISPNSKKKTQDTSTKVQKFADHNYDSSQNAPNQLTTNDTIANNGIAENLAWADSDSQNAFLTDLDARIAQHPVSNSVISDPLHAACLSSFNYDLQGTNCNSSRLSHLPYNPLEYLRPLMQAQNRLINNTLLRYLFEGCQIRKHLNLQHQYHLFGNGHFVARLSTAMFSSEMQSAERKRGNIPTSEAMGLRLGTREGQKWPPASSELRLTLMGILSETYGQTNGRSTTTSVEKVLPGGLSFSVRELPDAEIEKVMDATSIYALDFLRLQYVAPPPLDAILTSPSLESYDKIFRLLLRLLRVLHVTTRFRESVISIDRSPRSEQREGKAVRVEVRFALQAHHFILVFMSHVMDIGIDVSWRAFNLALDAVERSLGEDHSHTDAVSSKMTGIDDIRQLHESFLRDIQTRLFLRRKQEKFQNSLEYILTNILGCAGVFERRAESTPENKDTAFQKFRASLANLKELLRVGVTKPPRKTSASDVLEEDTEAMRMLLLRLDWNGFL